MGQIRIKAPGGLLGYKRDGAGGGGGGPTYFLGIKFSIPAFLGVEDLTVYFFLGPKNLRVFFFWLEFPPG